MQQQEARALEVRLKLQSQNMARKEAALERVERRELSALMRDQRTEQRVRDRGEDGAMPSPVHIAGLDDAAEAERDRDLLIAFEIARVGRQQEPLVGPFVGFRVVRFLGFCAVSRNVALPPAPRHRHKPQGSVGFRVRKVALKGVLMTLTCS